MSDRERESTTTEDVVYAEQIQGSGGKTCTNCGDPIDEYEWFPIRGREDEDGRFRVYSFCSEECVETWEGPEP